MANQVKLSAILQALEIQGDETHALLDRRTEEVLGLSDEELRAAENDDDLSDYPDWQRETVEQAKAVQSDDTGRFMPLPDRFEIDEWEMMRDFAMNLKDENLAEILLRAIDGRGRGVGDTGDGDPWRARGAFGAGKCLRERRVRGGSRRKATS